MIESLLSTFGLFGGALVIGFCAGMFPVISIELFLIGISTWATPTPVGLVLLVLLAATGHQVAKTICYFIGIGALEKANDKLRARVEKVRTRIDRWNKRPKVIMYLAATVGIPPLIVLAYIAKPLMNMRFVPFTIITYTGRVGRYAFLMLVPLIFG